jgi:hypothetical protein
VEAMENARYRRAVAAGDLGRGFPLRPARDAVGAETYVLCEINASSCFGIRDEAPAAIARTIKDRLQQTFKTIPADRRLKPRCGG